MDQMTNEKGVVGLPQSYEKYKKNLRLPACKYKYLFTTLVNSQAL